MYGPKQSVIAIVRNVITDTCLVLGLLAGVLGIFLAVSARTYTARAVAECAELIQGSTGPRGTVDPRALRDLAVVRYDALREMSGQLSFSVALLNAAGDGVVLSSINGRSETRTYAKIVLRGVRYAGTVARRGTGGPFGPAGRGPAQRGTARAGPGTGATGSGLGCRDAARHADREF